MIFLLTHVLLASVAIFAMANPVELAATTLNSICGFWYNSASSSLYQFACAPGTQCMIATYLTPNYAWCGPSGMAPKTTEFGYGQTPTGGCTSGVYCCTGTALPAVGTWAYNSRSTTLLACWTSSGPYQMALEISIDGSKYSGSLETYFASPVPTTTDATVTPTSILISTSTGSNTQGISTQGSGSDKLSVGSEVSSIAGAIAGVLSVLLALLVKEGEVFVARKEFLHSQQDPRTRLYCKIILRVNE